MVALAPAFLGFCILRYGLPILRAQKHRLRFCQYRLWTRFGVRIITAQQVPFGAVDALGAASGLGAATCRADVAIRWQLGSDLEIAVR
jgi:hypothetical protein